MEPLSKHEQELKDRSEKIVKELTGLVNSMSFKPDYFIEKMSRDHRTLQQSFTKLCLQWLEYVASDEYRIDARNEGSHEVCKRIIEMWRDQADLGLSYNYPPSQGLPMI